MPIPNISNSVPAEVPHSEIIAAYHRDAERRCLADYANDSHPEGYYCPCLPTEFRKYREVYCPYTLPVVAGGVRVAVITGRVDGRLSTLSVNKDIGGVWSGASDELQYCMAAGP